MSKRVAFVYPHMPHYRFGVFSAIEAERPDVAFIADHEARDATIATIPEGTFRREVRVRNIWLGPILWQRGVGRALRRVQPDCVVFLGDAAHLSTWFHAVTQRLRGRRVAFWTIGWHKPDRGARRLIRLAFYRLAHQLLLYGEHARGFGARAGYPESRMTVIFNSFESKASAPADASPLQLEQLNESRPAVGAVIRLSRNKGLDKIISAVRVLREDHGLEVDCLLVGEGPVRRDLIELAAKEDVRLLLPGAVYDSGEIARIYEHLRVTVVPEAVGLTALQSLAHATPVVTCAQPERQMPEFEAIVHESNGFLVSEANAVALADGIMWALNHADVPAMERACRAPVEQTWNARNQAKLILRWVDSA